MSKVYLFLIFTTIVGYLDGKSIEGALTGAAVGCGIYFAHEIFELDFLDGKIK